MTSMKDFFTVFGLFVGSFIIFIWGVSGQEVIGFDSRFYLFAQEMWRHGFSWFPTTYAEPYPDYPGASTWVIYAVASLLGKLDKLAASIPTALMASLTVVLTYMIGALHNKRWGFYAALLLLFTIAYLKAARSISLDIYSTVITAWCFYLVYSADAKDKHGREWFIYPLLLLGFIFRGPIGLIIPAGVVCTYYLFDWNIKNLFFTAMLSLFTLVIASFMLLGIAHHVGGEPFIHKVLLMQAFGRLHDTHLPFYYYAVHALDDYAISLPFALAVIVGVAYYRLRLKIHSPDLILLLKFVGWVAVVVIGMSIPGDKKIRYVLPVAPALALLAAYPFVAYYRDRYFVMLHAAFLYFFASLPLLFFVALYVMPYAYPGVTDTLKLDYGWLKSLLMLMFSISLTAVLRLKHKAAWRDTVVLLISLVSFVLVYINVVEVVQYYHDRTRETVELVEAKRLAANATLVFYDLHPDGLPIKYLINTSEEVKPSFLDQPDQLAALSMPAVIVMRQTTYAALPLLLLNRFSVIAMDRLGHVPVVIITNIK